MLNCIYNKKRINAFIIDEGDYSTRKNIRLDLIRAGRENKLLCEECGHPVDLRAGPVKAPHFAHKQGFRMMCTYNEYSSKESEAHRLGKKILFFYLKDLYPQANIQLDYPLGSKRRANIYIEMRDEKLAIELQKFNINPEEWDKKFKDYQSLNIPNLWIVLEELSEAHSYENEKCMEFYKQMVLNESADGIITFFDVNKEKITIGKNMVYKDIEGKKVLYEDFFIGTYSLNDVRILLSGQIQSPFQNDFEKAQISFFENCREQEQSMISKSQSAVHKEFQIPMQQSMFENTSEISNKLSNMLKNQSSQPYNIEKQNASSKWNYNSAKRKGYIDFCIRKARYGDLDYLDKLANIVHSGVKDYKLMKDTFRSLVDSGDAKACELFQQILQKANFTDDL